MNKNTKIKKVYQKLIDGVNNIISSGQYKSFLKFCNNFNNYSFNNYSFNNLILIFSQMPEAKCVAGFKTWERLGRKIKCGSKGIMIMFPMKREYTKKVKVEDKEEQRITYLSYRPTYVYDISQTIGKDILLESKRLQSNNKIELFNFLKSYSIYPILEKEIERYSFRILESN